MTTMPDALARWERELSWLAPELAPALAPMLPRLALAIGPLRRSRRDTGEPDGYGRLTRRGPFDRLLASQWALLDEVPEDFLRRASSNELLFFELARTEPRGGERSIALFDAGPFSLGSPRLAHLAVLVVLARRAAEAGVPFFWSTLREPILRPFVGEESVRQLLGAPTPFRVTDANLDAWRDLLAAPGGDAREARRTPSRANDELFVVADGDTLAAVRARLGAWVAGLVVDTGLASPRDALALEVSRAQAPARGVTLPLPEPVTCVRLLRDPFRARARAQPPPSPRAATSSEAWRAELDDAPSLEHGLVISRDGRKVIVRGRSGRLLAIAAPDTSSKGRVLVRHLAQDRVLHAVGVAGRRVVTLVEDKRGALRICEIHGGARDLDEVELTGIEHLRGGGGPRALALGLATPASRAPDLAVRTSRGLLLWSKIAAGLAPRSFAANGVVPIGSGGQGFALAIRCAPSDAPRELGAGYVYEHAHDTDPRAVVARARDERLVVVREGPSQDAPKRRAEALAREPRIAGLDAILEVREEAGVVRIVTELLAGPTLASLLRRGRQGPPPRGGLVAVWVARELARAVASLEDARLAPHGGVSPRRIRLSSEGEVRLEHALDWSADPSAPSPVSPELAYVAPEQLRGLPPDPRADVYAIGLVLHELLTGEHATEKRELFSRLGAIAAGELVDLAARWPEVPPELHAIVRTATAHNPEARFSSARSLSHALELWLDGARVDASDVIRSFGLDEEPTLRRVRASAWTIQLLRHVELSLERGQSIERASQVVCGGTAGGDGLFGFVEGDHVRIVRPGPHAGHGLVSVPPGAEVVGVCGMQEVVVRRAESLELRDGTGVLAGLAIGAGARVVMAAGWPHVAVLEREGRVRLWSASERRVVLDASPGAGASR